MSPFLARMETLPTLPFLTKTTREKKETQNEEVLVENKIYELPKIELGGRLANVLGTEGDEILEDDFLQVKELEDKNIEEIKEEYDINKIKGAFNEAVLFHDVESLSKSFDQACNILLPNNKNIGFVDFLRFDRRQHIMTKSGLPIHVEWEIFFTKISIQIKIFIVFFW